MNSNKLIAIAPFFLSVASATAWADHSPGHDSVARDRVVDLQEHVEAGNQSRIAADQALQQQIDALKAETTLTDVGNCNNGEVAKSNGAGGWACEPDSVSNPDSQTLGDLECTQEGDIAVFSGGQWICRSDIPAPPRFVDNGDGTVTDNVTGLMWEKKQECGLDGMTVNFNNPHCVANTYSWTADGIDGTLPNGTLYTDFLARLNLEVTGDVNTDCFATHCDWRIPNVHELQTILSGSGIPCSPCLETIFGPTGTIPGYWTLSTVASNRHTAWIVSFNSGLVLMDSKSDEDVSNPGNNFARAVRGGR